VLAARWGDSLAIFASKAFPCTAVLRAVAQEGLGCDVAGAGELVHAVAAGVDPALIYLHGNAKTDEDLERAIDAGEVTVDDVFDRDYQLIEGTNPGQYNVRFNEAADSHVRPILDRTKSADNRIIGSAIGDMNGYLPTHLSERSHPQGPDPVWNDEHCRNKRILIDDATRNALASERPATLATYRMELGDKFIPVKNVFVPLWFKGRRWGNFELAYRDD